MRHTRLVPALVAACLAASACSDSDVVGPTRSPPALTPPTQLLVTLSGTVRLTGDKDYPVALAMSDGDEIPLAGPETDRLARVENAEVEVRGTWEFNVGFRVLDFVVSRVDGADVMDGVLVELYDEDDGHAFLGYALRLTRSANIAALSDPPAELIEHVGERVWVKAPSDGPPTAFGVIGK